MAGILRQIYYGRYILQQTYYGRYISAYIYYGAHMLQQIHYGIYITAIILWQICDGRYITADIVQQIYYSRDITADILRTTKRPYLNKCAAPEALDCYIRVCLLQRIAPRAPLDRLIQKSAGKHQERASKPTPWRRSRPL